MYSLDLPGYSVCIHWICQHVVCVFIGLARIQCVYSLELPECSVCVFIGIARIVCVFIGITRI